MPNTTNGRLWFKNMIVYRLGSSSHKVMFISPRSRKRKMAMGSGSKESTLDRLIGVLLYLTGWARERPPGAW